MGANSIYSPPAFGIPPFSPMKYWLAGAWAAKMGRIKGGCGALQRRAQVLEDQQLERLIRQGGIDLAQAESLA